MEQQARGAGTAAASGTRAAADFGAPAPSGHPAGGSLEGDSDSVTAWGTWTWGDPVRACPEAGRATASALAADSVQVAAEELGGARQGVHDAGSYPRQAGELGVPAAAPAPGSPAAAADALNSTLMSALIHGQGAPALVGAATVSSEPTPAPTLPGPSKGAGLTAPLASVVSSEALEASAAAGPGPSPATGAGGGQEAGGSAAPGAAGHPRPTRLKPSAKAAFAVWELLEACIAKPGTASAPAPGAYCSVKWPPYWMTVS